MRIPVPAAAVSAEHEGFSGEQAAALIAPEFFLRRKLCEADLSGQILLHGSAFLSLPRGAERAYPSINQNGSGAFCTLLSRYCLLIAYFPSPHYPRFPLFPPSERGFFRHPLQILINRGQLKSQIYVRMAQAHPRANRPLDAALFGGRFSFFAYLPVRVYRVCIIPKKNFPMRQRG